MTLSDTRSVAAAAASTAHSTPSKQDAPQAVLGQASSAGTCHCGDVLVSCVGCAELRCVTCDPYVSDDC
jgi:hypothetical protein